MEKRNLFDRIASTFKKNKDSARGGVVLANSGPSWIWNGDPYENDVVRAAVGAIARNAAKMQAKHMYVNGDQSRPAERSQFEHLLAVRPNKVLDAYTFWQRAFTILLLEGNCYIWIERDYVGADPQGLYIVMPKDVELLETSNGVIVAKVKLKQGGYTHVLYDDLIHLRRDVYRSDFSGESLTAVMEMPMKVLQASNQGMINAVKQSATLRGILKSNAMLKNEDIKKNRDEFVKDYLGIDNDGGIAGLDQRFEFIPIKVEPQSLNVRQIEQAKLALYGLYGINADFVNGVFSDQTWSAVYESVIEPLLIVASLECTAKLFSERQIGHGNRIVFDSNRLQYASVDTKVKVIQTLGPYGALTVDQCLTIFNLPTLGGEEGSKRLQTLNVVDATKANVYQGVDAPVEEVSTDDKEN